MRVAVASGKGGTGKTTVAVNLAVTASRLGHSVHLCDCDVEEPNAHIFVKPNIASRKSVSVPIPWVDLALCSHCGKCAEICEFNAIACLPDRTMVFTDLCHGCSGCWLVCPEKAIDPGRRIVGEVATGTADGMRFTHGRLQVGEIVVPPLIAAVKAAAGAEQWIVLDAPPGVTCPVVETIRDADYVLLVTEPTPFGQHDLALAVELARAVDRPCGVVVNRATAGRDLIDEYCATAGVRILARIPFRRSVAEACAEGQLAIEADAEISGIMTDLLRTLQAREVVV